MRKSVRHVLLMLSTDQPPHPADEVRWHAEYCVRNGKTAVVTTRPLSGLTRGQSIVAFYGSTDLGNGLLGRGLFAGFGLLDQDRGRQMLAGIPLYADALPEGAQGMVQLTDF